MMDGTFERARSERARARELQRQSELLSEKIVERLQRFDRPAFGESGDTFALRLARVRPAVALVRHSVGRWLEGRGVPTDIVREITLACSEACANAVEHPVGSVEAAFEVVGELRENEVVIVVRDTGRWRSGPGGDARGRGMELIRSLMTDVDVQPGDNGTRIVMRRRLR